MAHSPARSPLEVGSVIAGTYVLEQLIGRGGMGAVFLATHLRLPGKLVAIKVLHADATDDEVLARFRHEATIASQLNHPNIVEVHDFNAMPDGTPYLVLEFLEGETLYERLRRGPLALDHALSIMREVGSALAAAHRIGVIHRDLKPQNIFLVRTEIDGRTIEVAKVLDFGISKMRSSQTVKTQDNALLGTPQYMSPEQAIGQHTKVDERTDVFALGSILYEMLCGHPAFTGASIPEVVFKVVYEQPLSIVDEAPTLPRSITAAIQQAMQKAADDRFASVGGFVEALTGEPLALPNPTGERSAVDGPTSAARKASLARGASAARAMPAMGTGAAAGIGETHGPGIARREGAGPSAAREVVSGVGATMVGMSGAPGAAPVLAGGATMESQAPGAAPGANAMAATVAAPITAAPVVGAAPATAPTAGPVAAAKRPPVRLVAVVVIAAAAVGAAVYFAMRAPPAPAAHAPLAVIDAAAPPPVDAAVVAVAPADAAGSAVAAAPADARAAAPHDAARPEAAGSAAADDRDDGPDLAAAEAALTGQSWRAATLSANAVIRDPATRPKQHAHALAIHAIAACADGARDTVAIADLDGIAQLPARYAGPARTRVIAACKKMGLLDGY